MIFSQCRQKHLRIKTAKGRKRSSAAWLQRQINDQYVIRAQSEGYRSRAAYKIIEINQKFQIFKPGFNVIDLGAAPGGWAQVAAKLIQTNYPYTTHKLIAIDLLLIDSIPGVVSIQGNFHDASTLQTIHQALDGGVADVVLSDMAANTTGHNQTDHLRTMALCEAAFHFATHMLKPGGHFIAKIFRGGTENELLQLIKQEFNTVKHFKPQASRQESSELYLIALNKR